MSVTHQLTGNEQMNSSEYDPIGPFRNEHLEL